MAALIRKESTPYLRLEEEVRAAEQSAPGLQMTPAVQSRANDIYKRAEALYLATYKAIHLNGRETSESRLVRLAIKPHCSAGSERLSYDQEVALAEVSQNDLALQYAFALQHSFPLFLGSERLKGETMEEINDAIEKAGRPYLLEFLEMSPS
jgi:hypothetical protein